MLAVAWEYVTIRDCLVPQTTFTAGRFQTHMQMTVDPLEFPPTAYDATVGSPKLAVGRIMTSVERGSFIFLLPIGSPRLLTITTLVQCHCAICFAPFDFFLYGGILSGSTRTTWIMNLPWSSSKVMGFTAQYSALPSSDFVCIFHRHWPTTISSGLSISSSFSHVSVCLLALT